MPLLGIQNFVLTFASYPNGATNLAYNPADGYLYSLYGRYDGTGPQTLCKINPATWVSTDLSTTTFAAQVGQPATLGFLSDGRLAMFATDNSYYSVYTLENISSPTPTIVNHGQVPSIQANSAAGNQFFGDKVYCGQFGVDWILDVKAFADSGGATLPVEWGQSMNVGARFSDPVGNYTYYATGNRTLLRYDLNDPMNLRILGGCRGDTAIITGPGYAMPVTVNSLWVDAIYLYFISLDLQRLHRIDLRLGNDQQIFTYSATGYRRYYYDFFPALGKWLSRGGEIVWMQ